MDARWRLTPFTETLFSFKSSLAINIEFLGESGVRLSRSLCSFSVTEISTTLVKGVATASLTTLFPLFSMGVFPHADNDRINSNQDGQKPCQSTLNGHQNDAGNGLC